MVRITGAKQHAARLRALAGGGAGVSGGKGGRMAEKINAVLFEAGQALQVDAQISITEGSTNAKGQHVRSLPGQPPNEEIGTLADGIETLNTAPLRVEVSSNAPHAAALEFGTSKMAERPYMRPAAERARKTLPGEIAAAVSKVIRETKG